MNIYKKNEDLIQIKQSKNKTKKVIEDNVKERSKMKMKVEEFSLH